VIYILVEGVKRRTVEMKARTWYVVVVLGSFLSVLSFKMENWCAVWCGAWLGWFSNVQIQYRGKVSCGESSNDRKVNGMSSLINPTGQLHSHNSPSITTIFFSFFTAFP